MARSRKNSGIIGRLTSPKPSSKSGVYSVDDSYLIKGPEKGSTIRTPINRLTEGLPYIDKYGSLTAVHFSDVHYNDHLYKDKSDYGWDEYYATIPYNRPGTGMSYSGPRYRDWCTKFYDNAGYLVADYAGIRLGTGAFTIEFWFKLERYDSTQQYVMSKGTLAGLTSGGTGWTIYINTTRNIGFYSGANNVSIIGGAVIARYVVSFCSLSCNRWINY